MFNLLRLYNQNRTKVIITIIIIIFIFIIISLFNLLAKNQNEEKIMQAQNIDYENTYKYYNESKSMVSGGTVSEVNKNKFGDLLNSFLSYCQNHESEKAYGLLSKECKEIMYPTVQVFEKQYCDTKFPNKKRYSFQSWTASDTYIYMVKIFDDMLSTGTGSAQKYIQEYISIVQEGENYKLNVNGLVGKINIGKQKNTEGIIINVKDRYVYMDYGVYTMKIKNNTENTILLDSRRETNTTYVVDENDNKYEALLYEILDDDLIIKPGEEKQIKIKFSDAYQEKNKIKKVVFSDVYFNTNNISYGTNNQKIELEI